MLHRERWFNEGRAFDEDENIGSWQIRQKQWPISSLHANTLNDRFRRESRSAFRGYCRAIGINISLIVRLFVSYTLSTVCHRLLRWIERTLFRLHCWSLTYTKMWSVWRLLNSEEHVQPRNSGEADVAGARATVWPLCSRRTLTDSTSSFHQLTVDRDWKHVAVNALVWIFLWLNRETRAVERNRQKCRFELTRTVYRPSFFEKKRCVRKITRFHVHSVRYEHQRSWM